MSYSLTQLEALQNAISKGVKSITYNGETVTYRSIDEMLLAERRIKKALGLVGDSRRRFTSYDKGL